MPDDSISADGRYERQTGTFLKSRETGISGRQINLHACMHARNARKLWALRQQSQCNCSIASTCACLAPMPPPDMLGDNSIRIDAVFFFSKGMRSLRIACNNRALYCNRLRIGTWVQRQNKEKLPRFCGLLKWSCFLPTAESVVLSPPLSHCKATEETNARASFFAYVLAPSEVRNSESTSGFISRWNWTPIDSS
jgi:hypothetical protein